MPTKKKTAKRAASKKIMSKKKVVKKTVKKAAASAKGGAPLKPSKQSKKNVRRAPNKKAAPAIAIKRVEVTKKAVSSAGSKIRVHIQRLVWWGTVSVFLLGALAIIANYSTALNRSELLPEKLAQVSVLSAEYADPIELPPEEKPPVTIMAVGDVMLARYVERKMRGNQDYTWPFHNSAEFLRDADITFANLESPLLAGANVEDNVYYFRADPSAAAGLSWAGFDVLSIANNHTMDYREYGLQTTLDALRAAGLDAVGGGKNVDEAHTPVMKLVNGQRIAFYAYTDNSIPPGFNGVTTDSTPGIAGMNVEAVQNDVKNALRSADFVVVSMHAGREYSKEPTGLQKEFARAAIDAGASVVIGHHPHVVQPVEWYGDGLILYSLGNFVFDQFFDEEVRTGLAAKISLQKDKRPVLKLYPTRLETVQTDVVIEEPRRSELLEKLGVAY
ncbi:hypothetical protein COV82_04390 [Candidatus Peregrinibacteria bacterium CG11_big_fil_rev_8_21_14_0_20_46_8]|nr:MAG: hypothetical protein COV82_04390 [Candidatus Peregrinibacteria bacterium CG11_big_fil_rev_8_21_14_0_20_46_8]